MIMMNTQSQKIYRSILLVFLWGLFIIYFGPSFSIQLNAQNSWSFEEVLTLAEDQSIFRHQAAADNKIAKSRWNFYKANLNPGVNLDVLAPNFVKTSREIVQPDGSIAFQSVSQNNSSIGLGIQQQLKATGGTIFLRSQLQRFDDFSLDANQYNGVPFRIGIAQPIFGFNELKWAGQVEPLSLQEADRKYIIDMEDIHLRASIFFFDLLLAQVNEKIAQTNSEVNATLVDIAKNRFELGKISRNELLQLELEYKSAIKNLSAASFQVDFAKGALYTFLGKNENDQLEVSAPDPNTDNLVIDLNKALEEARANRPEVVSFERQKIEAQRDINQAKTDYGIRADLFASFGVARGSQKLSEIYTDAISEQQVQLSISVPILDWGRKKSAVGMAKAQQELIEQQIAQSQLDFDNDIIQAINRWAQLQQEIQLQEEISSVSQERFEISRQRYVLGDISITDLTIAQREKDQAQRNYVNTLRSYWITYYQIRKLTGYDFERNEPITYYLN